LTNSAWQILADFYIRSGGFEKNPLATLVECESATARTERRLREKKEEAKAKQTKANESEQEKAKEEEEATQHFTSQHFTLTCGQIRNSQKKLRSK
jgi:hypothetical protein